MPTPKADDEWRISGDWMAEMAARYREKARAKGPMTPARLRWARVKDAVGVVMVFVFLAIFAGMMFDTAIRNGQCDVVEFITFKCNRWHVEFKNWNDIDYRD